MAVMIDERDRREDDQRQPPVAEEQQDHQRRQPGRHAAAHQHAVQRGLDEDRLVEDRLDVDARRHQLLRCRAALADAVDHRQRRDAAGLADRSSARRAGRRR